jgi:hypothetical protein
MHAPDHSAAGSEKGSRKVHAGMLFYMPKQDVCFLSMQGGLEGRLRHL